VVNTLSLFARSLSLSLLSQPSPASATQLCAHKSTHRHTSQVTCTMAYTSHLRWQHSQGDSEACLSRRNSPGEPEPR
jgi:hypothetical protein